MCSYSMDGRELAQHGIRRKVVARDRRVADLAKPGEVDPAPIDLADLGKAPSNRRIDRAHRELKVHILLGEVAAIMVVAENHHRPCPDEEMAAMSKYHLALQDPLD